MQLSEATKFKGYMARMKINLLESDGGKISMWTMTVFGAMAAMRYVCPTHLNHQAPRASATTLMQVMIAADIISPTNKKQRASFKVRTHIALHKLLEMGWVETKQKNGDRRTVLFEISPWGVRKTHELFAIPT